MVAPQAGPGRDHGDEHRPEAWLVRHGETEWSRSGQHTSRTDMPLTDRGREQARELGARLAGHDFALVLSSPMRRALDTANLAGFAERVEVDLDLCEWDYGIYEGETTPKIRESEPGWTVWTHPLPEGETRSEVTERADRIIRRIREVDGDVAIFSHGHFLRVLGARWIGFDAAEGRNFALDTATISLLGWERERAVIERWNEVCGA